MNRYGDYIPSKELGQKFAQTRFIAHSWQSPNWRRPATVKPYAQLIYVAAGYGKMMIAGQHFEITPGHVFVIEPHQICGELVDSHDSGDIWFCYLLPQEYPHLLPGGQFLPGPVNPRLDFTAHHEFTLATLKKAEQFFYQNTYESVRLGKMLISSIAEVAKTMYCRQPYGFIFPPENLELNVLHYLYEHYADELTLNDLANHFGFSPAYLSRRFSTYWGTGPLQCLMDIRMIEARMLLCNTALSIREVASHVGYGDVHYFTRIFTKKQGMSPGRYRESYTDIPTLGISPL